MMLRYTRRGDWVLDPFLGSGTTLIECRRLGRNGLGIELNPDVCARAAAHIDEQDNRYACVTDAHNADSRTIAIGTALRRHGVSQAQLLILHPPYHDIIRFSEDQRDLSCATDTQAFLHMFGEVVDNVSPFLESGRYCAVVIGDKYSKGEWIPLGFRCMEEMLRRGYTLKSIVVKNFDETRAKRHHKELWRYRALAGGFFVFKHEYVFILQKR
jgi:tRNA G10  N-methylase Trm11